MDTSKLKKEIGLVTLISLGIGSTIGSGIYAMPAVMAEAAGPSLIISIIMAGIVTAFLASIYAELGSAFPLTGGPYVLPRLAMGNLTGFLMGWGYFIYLFTGTAAIIDIFVTYLGYFIPGLSMVGGSLTPAGIAVAVIALWVFTIINILGVKWGGLYSIITTFGKLIPLFIFGLLGLMMMNTANFTPFMPFGAGGMAFAVTLFFWAFVGFETVVVPSEEVVNPSRNIPLAMFLSVGLTTIVYVVVAVAFVGMIDWNSLSLATGNWAGVGILKSALSDVSGAMKLFWLATLTTIGAMISTAGAGGNWVLIQGRLPFAMAKDKLFLTSLEKIHPRFGTPHFSLIFSSVLTTIVMIVIPNFPSVALIASITAIIPYSAAALALPILRRTNADTPRPFQLPFGFLVSLTGFILASFLIYWGSWPWTLVGCLLVFAGYPVYLIAKKSMDGMERALWVPVYLLGMVAFSILGDPRFEYKNFTAWKPLGLITAPYDLIAIAIFSCTVFVLGYFTNTKREHIISPPLYLSAG